MDCFFCTKPILANVIHPLLSGAQAADRGCFLIKSKLFVFCTKQGGCSQPVFSKETALNKRKLEQNREFYKKGRLKKEF